jgi:Domain of unknown function (DUF1906)
MVGKPKRIALSTSLLAAAGMLLPLSIAPLVSRRIAALSSPPTRSYRGFDRNEYPGDDAMKTLRRDFVFTGYWLSPPPEEKENTWHGKREFLRSQGYGFLLLYRGPDSRELKNETAAKEKGTHDARDAAATAKNEGFPAGAIIFLDIEEGGRLPPAYHAYLRAFADELTHSAYRAGVYCSAISPKEDSRVDITTTDDIRSSEAPREFVFWAYNDACPPSPGCAFPQNPPSPSASGAKYATIWQFVQSPRRKEYTRHCAAKYSRDGNCYAPSDAAHKWFLDVNSADSSDPSGGRK